MFEAICREKLAPLTLRITLGLICCYHGFLKIMAAGGTNWYPGLPTGWQLVIAWCEFAGGLAILLGFRCRISAAVVVAITAGTLGWLQGWGLFRQPVRSLEPTFMILMIGVALLCLGAGEFSVDGGGFSLAPARVPKRKS